MAGRASLVLSRVVLPLVLAGHLHGVAAALPALPVAGARARHVLVAGHTWLLGAPACLLLRAEATDLAGSVEGLMGAGHLTVVTGVAGEGTVTTGEPEQDKAWVSERNLPIRLNRTSVESLEDPGLRPGGALNGPHPRLYP